MDIIKALKDNCKPFGLMPEEMQAKAQDIGQQEFKMYMKDGTWSTCGGYDNFGSKIVTDQTYRLRPDYEEKPEIVESWDLQIECSDGDSVSIKEKLYGMEIRIGDEDNFYACDLPFPVLVTLATGILKIHEHFTIQE